MSDFSRTAYHIAAHPELYEPARSYSFEFILNKNLDTLLMEGVDESTATENDYLHNVQEKMRVAVSSCDIPHYNIDPITVKRGNGGQAKFAGGVTWSAGTLKLHDFVGARIKDILLAWKARAYNLTEDVVNPASNYKFDCDLIEYTSDYKKIIRRWKMIGCWVSKIQDNTLSHGDTRTERELSATIEYDRAIPIVEDVL